MTIHEVQKQAVLLDKKQLRTIKGGTAPVTNSTTSTDYIITGDTDVF